MVKESVKISLDDIQKPKIRWSKEWSQWLCCGSGVMGNGSTCTEAYNSWEARITRWSDGTPFTEIYSDDPRPDYIQWGPIKVYPS